MNEQDTYLFDSGYTSCAIKKAGRLYSVCGRTMCNTLSRNVDPRTIFHAPWCFRTALKIAGKMRTMAIEIRIELAMCTVLT